MKTFSSVVCIAALTIVFLGCGKKSQPQPVVRKRPIVQEQAPKPTLNLDALLKQGKIIKIELKSRKAHPHNNVRVVPHEEYDPNGYGMGEFRRLEEGLRRLEPDLIKTYDDWWKTPEK